MLPNIGIGELVVILAIALLLFGAKRLPELARGVGQSIQAFKHGLREVREPEEPQRPQSRELPDQKS